MRATLHQVVRLAKRDGNVIVRHIFQTNALRARYSRIPYQIQLLHIDHLPSWFSMPLDNGRRIVGGCEFSAEGELAYYHMFPVHRYDYLAQNGNRHFPTPIRIRASEISLVGEIPEPGAVRAMSPMLSAMPAARELYEYMEAEMVRKRAAADLNSGDRIVSRGKKYFLGPVL
jgi:capsid protein